MRHIKASEAKDQFDAILKEVEGGETVTIDRDGKPIARVVPTRDAREQRTPERQAEIERAIDEIRALREKTASVTIEEILAWRDEGRK